MKRLFIASCVLLVLGACQSDATSDTEVEDIETDDTAVAEKSEEVTVWNNPRRLYSLHTEGDVSVGLQREAVGKDESLILMIKNNSADTLNLSSDVTVLNRQDEHVGTIRVDDMTIEPGVDSEHRIDLSEIDFDRRLDGLFYTLKVPIEDANSYLDFYLGDALDLIAATPGWYGDEHEGLSEEDQDLIDWITRHQ